MRHIVMITLLSTLCLAGAPAVAESPVTEHQAKWDELRERGRGDGGGKSASGEERPAGEDELPRQRSGRQGGEDPAD